MKNSLCELSPWQADVTVMRQQIRETPALTKRPNLNFEWSQDERFAACLGEGVSVVSLFWGDPARRGLLRVQWLVSRAYPKPLGFTRERYRFI
jgi:hypothetical protein